MKLKDHIPNLIFLFFIQMLIIGVIISPQSVYPELKYDEGAYQNISKEWNAHGIHAVINYGDNKPLTFLFLERSLGMDKTVLYSRILNFILILSISYLIFDLTKRKESFLFILIPIFLNSMFLTVEIIESIFILLSIRFAKQSGIFIGLAVLFRPYALLYTLLVEKKQRIYIFGLGVTFSIYLYSQDAFFPYLFRLIHYVTEARLEDDWVGLSLMIPLAYLGLKNKQIFKYGLVACFPLILHLWSHYMLTPYTLFYLSWLSNPKLNIPEDRI